MSVSSNADLQMFTRKATAALGGKNESTTKRIVLGIERQGGTNVFEGSKVFIL